MTEQSTQHLTTSLLTGSSTRYVHIISSKVQSFARLCKAPQLHQSSNRNSRSKEQAIQALTGVPQIYAEAGLAYGDAVRRCILCEFDQRRTDLEDVAFCRKVYDGVVSVLEQEAQHFPSMP